MMLHLHRPAGWPVCRRDVAAMIALAGAEVLGGGKEEAGFSPLRIAAGLELLRLANVAEAKRARRS